MTKQEYDSINNFPVTLRSTVVYSSEKTNLRPGQLFTALSKRQLGDCDFSFIDENGNPHFYECCETINGGHKSDDGQVSKVEDFKTQSTN